MMEEVVGRMAHSTLQPHFFSPSSDESESVVILWRFCQTEGDLVERNNEQRRDREGQVDLSSQLRLIVLWREMIKHECRSETLRYEKTI